MIYYEYNLDYKKSFSIQELFLNTVHQIFVPVQVCTADTWQLTILQEIKRFILFIC